MMGRIDGRAPQSPRDTTPSGRAAYNGQSTGIGGGNSRQNLWVGEKADAPRVGFGVESQDFWKAQLQPQKEGVSELLPAPPSTLIPLSGNAPFQFNLQNTTQFQGGFPTGISPQTNSIQQGQNGTSAGTGMRQISPQQAYFQSTGRIDGRAPQSSRDTTPSGRAAYNGQSTEIGGFTPQAQWDDQFKGRNADGSGGQIYIPKTNPNRSYSSDPNSPTGGGLGTAQPSSPASPSSLSDGNGMRQISPQQAYFQSTGRIDASAPQSPGDTTPSGVAARNGQSTEIGGGFTPQAQWDAQFKGRGTDGSSPGQINIPKSNPDQVLSTSPSYPKVNIPTKSIPTPNSYSAY